jgi:hypothetical protein
MASSRRANDDMDDIDSAMAAPLKSPLLPPSPSKSDTHHHQARMTRAGGHLQDGGAGGPPRFRMFGQLIGPFARHSSKIQKALLLSAYYGLGVGVYGHLEGWGFTDCVYFTTASVTTVGYGDIVPATHAGMLFSIFFLGAGLVLVGSLLNELGHAVLARAEEVMLEKLDDDPTDDIPPDDRWQLVIAFVMMLAYVLFGMVYFALAQGCGLMGGEDTAADPPGAIAAGSGCWRDPWSSAFYFSLVTISSCGYGDYAPTSAHAKWFAIFYILAGSVVFAFALEKVADVHFARIAEAKKQKFLAMELDVARILEMDDSGDGKVDKGEFLLKGLVSVGALRENDAHAMRIMAAFDKYDVSGDGKLDEEDLRLLVRDMEEEREQSAAAVSAKEEVARLRRAASSLFGGRLTNGMASAEGSARHLFGMPPSPSKAKRAVGGGATGERRVVRSAAAAARWGRLRASMQFDGDADVAAHVGQGQFQPPPPPPVGQPSHTRAPEFLRRHYFNFSPG